MYEKNDCLIRIFEKVLINSFPRRSTLAGRLQLGRRLFGHFESYPGLQPGHDQSSRCSN